jgi:hypothetical protein
LLSEDLTSWFINADESRAMSSRTIGVLPLPGAPVMAKRFLVEFKPGSVEKPVVIAESD